jgi:catechol 2,3-dioxygenase-like lactoylglutathione lyase family enzyme
MRWELFLALALLRVTPVAAQVAPFNTTGVTMGHVHLNVPDIEAQLQFWSKLGGQPFENKKLLPQRMIQFPGIYIIVRPQQSEGGSEGSVVDHIGFHVKNLNDWLPKWNTAGFKVQKGDLPGRVMITAPDNIRVEIIEDPSISTPIAMHHVHLFLPDTAAAQAWYIKVFGAIAGSRPSGKGGAYPLAQVPGAEFAFTKTDGPQAPTKGRALDHIGFDVRNLEQFVQRLATLGVPIEYPVRPTSNDENVKVTHITDPWGTRIELTEGSPRVAQGSAIH